MVPPYEISQLWLSLSLREKPELLSALEEKEIFHFRFMRYY